MRKVNLMPRTKKPTSKPKAPKAVSKTKFILDQPAALPAAEVVAKGKAAGLSLTAKYVWRVRSAAKAKGGAKLGAKKAAVGRTARTVKVSGSLTTSAGLAAVAPLDLAYAVGRLIADGRTTLSEMATLAAERKARIESLETELAALSAGTLPERGSVSPVRAAKPAKVVRKGPAKPGTVLTRRDGRTFTRTAKVVEARRWQGQYLGYLRQVPEKDKARYKAMAREKGVPAAVAELKKRLGKA